MTEDEKEDLVYRLWQEFAESVNIPFDDERKFDFVAGARSAIYELTMKGSPNR